MSNKNLGYYKVSFNFNVFGCFMIDWIGGK